MAGQQITGSSAYQDSLITLRVLFKGLDGDPVDVISPRLRFYTGWDNTPVNVDSLGVDELESRAYPLEPCVPPVTGQYSFSFLTTSLKPGLYQVEFAGETTEQRTATEAVPHTVLVKGEFEIGQISRLHDILNRAQMGLMDDFPFEYRLDEPIHQFKKNQIFVYIKEALSRINSTGPKITGFTIDSFPAGHDEFLVTGAKIWALWARARLEKANEMNYSDVHTLNIDRGPFYKELADAWFRDWLEAIISFKKATPPTPIGLKSQRLPFRVNRVIGLLPNYQTFFSG